mmetsp:Transcript_53408/g.171108  ORF Transcript_53408/g.171108 Transcript_53408/m.171108 type:complete len:268 (+) Transcript_53408:449-1252(+)
MAIWDEAEGGAAYCLVKCSTIERHSRNEKSMPKQRSLVCPPFEELPAAARRVGTNEQREEVAPPPVASPSAGGVVCGGERHDHVEWSEGRPALAVEAARASHGGSPLKAGRRHGLRACWWNARLCSGRGHEDRLSARNGIEARQLVPAKGHVHEEQAAAGRASHAAARSRAGLGSAGHAPREVRGVKLPEHALVEYVALAVLCRTAPIVHCSGALQLPLAELLESGLLPGEVDVHRAVSHVDEVRVLGGLRDETGRVLQHELPKPAL